MHFLMYYYHILFVLFRYNNAIHKLVEYVHIIAISAILYSDESSAAFYSTAKVLDAINYGQSI